MFLAGALVVELDRDLTLSAATLGFAVAITRAASALTAIPLGRLADRLSASRAIGLAGVVAAVSSLAIALIAQTRIVFIAFLVLSGVSLTLGDPAANRLLVKSVDPGKLAMAFGFKQSAPPTSTLIAGLSVPVIAVTLGWRAAYVFGGLLALTVAYWARAGGPETQPAPMIEESGSRYANRRFLVTMGVAFGLSIAGAITVPTFLVSAMVSSGAPQENAGLLLAGASVATILARLGLGFMVSRVRARALKLCALALIVGATGFLLLSLGEQVGLFVGSMLALAGSWGISGVFWFALVQSHSRFPGSVTGAVAPGGMLGAVIGPPVFGLLAEGLGYNTAWMFSALCVSLAAIGMMAGDRLIDGVR